MALGRGRPFAPRWRPDKRLWLAIGACLAVHLSAVTLFRVVIYYPIPEVRYHNMSYATAPSGTFGEGAGGGIILPPGDNVWTWLANIQARDKSSSALSLDYDSPEDDLQDLRDPSLELRDALIENLRATSRLTLGNTRSLIPDSNAETYSPVAGVSATITWPGREYSRERISTPLLTLWGIDASSLEPSVDIELTIDAAGRVTTVGIDEHAKKRFYGIEDELRRYLFAPAEAAEEKALLTLRPKALTP